LEIVSDVMKELHPKPSSGFTATQKSRKLARFDGVQPSRVLWQLQSLLSHLERSFTTRGGEPKSVCDDQSANVLSLFGRQEPSAQLRTKSQVKTKMRMQRVCALCVSPTRIENLCGLDKNDANQIAHQVFLVHAVK
jgi:hypothetical protein